MADTLRDRRDETRLLSLALPHVQSSHRLSATAIPGIEDYGLIGDSCTAALVSNTGSLDWLCLPDFHSPSFFNRLLDHTHGGYFLLAPADSFTTRRWYQESTAVLVTEFQTETGIVRVTDCMPVAGEETKRGRLMPVRAVVRHVEGMQGTVDMNVVFKPRPDDGRLVPRILSRGRRGYVIDLGNRLLHLSTTLHLSETTGMLHGRFDVRAGRTEAFWVTYSEDTPAVYPPLSGTDDVIHETARVWRRWVSSCTYKGPYRQAVQRSALTLKLLSYAPSGAIVAAPTSSLPETLGGVRNWDYRYCWLRDASFTAQLFFKLGFPAEARAFIEWLLHATTLTYPALQVMYDVFGEASLHQHPVECLAGYRGSYPVRIGNKAHRQVQMDVYGEVLEALWLYVEAGNPLYKDERQWLVHMADLVCTDWTFPDHGLWEIPLARRHYVHSKVMCWLALDRAERIVRRLGVQADVRRWQQTREAIQRTVLDTGYSRALQSLVQTLGSQDIDASALIVLRTGIIDPSDVRSLSTVYTIRQCLAAGDLLYRYRNDDGYPGREGAFLPCSFWLVEVLAMIGQRDEAVRLFERLQNLANDIGLYSEEMDPLEHRMLGNFPQALTHLGHIGAALRLSHTG